MIVALVAARDIHERFSGPHADYFGVALAAAVGWLGVPGVGEAAVIAAGIAAAHHRLDLPSMLAVTWTGAMLGGTGGWVIGLTGGRALMTARGPLLGVRTWLLGKGDRVYDRYGLMAVYLAPSWVAGVHDMHSSRFLPANALSAFAWTLLVGVGAFLIGPEIAEVVSGVGTYGIAVLVALCVLAWLRMRQVTAR